MEKFVPLVQPDNNLIWRDFSGNYNGIAIKRMGRLLDNGVYDPTFQWH
jgi:hypothetical protein